MTKFLTYTALLTLICLVPLGAQSQTLPGAHPGYLHALTDLRAARWFLSHQPGDPAVSGNEDVALHEVNAAIGDIKKASIDDGKNINDHPATDVQEHGSRLLQSIEALKQAHADIDGEEDNPAVQDLRRRALKHIDQALRAANDAHAAWLQQNRG